MSRVLKFKISLNTLDIYFYSNILNCNWFVLVVSKYFKVKVYS